MQVPPIRPNYFEKSCIVLGGVIICIVHSEAPHGFPFGALKSLGGPLEIIQQRTRVGSGPYQQAELIVG